MDPADSPVPGGDERRRGDGATLGPVAAPHGGWPARHRYALLALVVTLLTGVQTLNGQWSTDMWEHVAVVRELIAHPFDPSHPQLLSDATHPGFSPYTVLLGILGHVFHAEALTVLSTAAVVNVVLLLVALRLLVVELTANRRAPFWALLSMLALWGISPYRYSGFFSLNSIGFVAPYPSTFATAAGFGTLVAALRYAREGRRALLAPVTVGTALVVLVHPLSAPWLVVALLAVAIGRIRDRRRFASLAGAGAVALGLCLAWPYYPVLGLVGDSTGLESLNQAMYTNVLVRIFPALLGLVVIVRRSRADHRDLLGLLLGGSMGLYVVGAVIDNTSYGRSLAFGVIVLDIAVADGVGRIESRVGLRGARGRARLGWGLVAGLLLLGLVTTRAGLIRMLPEPLLPASVRGSEELIRPDEEYGFLVGLVGPMDVVIASRSRDDQVVPALAGRTLVLSVPRPFVEDADQRERDQREYLDPAATEVRRREIQARHQVRFVLLHVRDPRDRALLRSLRRGGAEEVHRDDELVLVELPPPR